MLEKQHNLLETVFYCDHKYGYLSFNAGDTEEKGDSHALASIRTLLPNNLLVPIQEVSAQLHHGTSIHPFGPTHQIHAGRLFDLKWMMAF
jgi:hypothetical protein